MTQSVVAYLGLGGNLGDVPATLRGALAALAAVPGVRMGAVSRFYRTPAWGMTAQPDFINAVVALETTLAPQALLAAMLEIERCAGRDRGDDALRWGPRTLDLDLLLYGDARLDLPGLQVPHPRLHERAFALLPLVEIAPDVVIPGVGPARTRLQTMAVTGIEAIR
ncbi:2-amino-4-hydroxy-6-hydroxymethyldihydropteridine diphosphokinase [Marilutibacter chinensis]|uniref:2-amino-4-hydroxy-6-hydroxymethyldihydropteridine pyrophosphokinase n=1 Tax=Marilutibacter chinensis TaxID=2912247 RepID=A0ABS9HRH8_9GAMM|nr:2-amino-4-hydroxy-6-hydroxymethyldihydropteridine diphosphokinase [Lysobacter chinensis]MCF7220917.1 2-amino-4-hydroxy-6-hydroxymethyldihydropteridine diphosphokinase [Lysobacter chinensis]